MRLYRWALSLGHSMGTIYNELIRAGIFLKYVQVLERDLNELSVEDLHSFISSKGCTGRNYINAIRNLAKANIEYYPKFYKIVKQVKYPRGKVKLPQLPSKRDVELLIESARQPYKSIITLLYEGGLRRCEVLSLKYGDVRDWDVGYKIVVRFSKSEPRTVFIVKYAHILRKWLEHHRSKNPRDWLFYNSYGLPIRPSGLTMYLRGLARRLGLNPDLLHPHNLRHLRATELYKSRKFTELEIMKWFGWKTREMIDIYSKTTMDDVEERVRELYGIKKNREDVNFCPRCGTKLDVEELSKELLSESEKLKKLFELFKAKLKEKPEVLARVLGVLLN